MIALWICGLPEEVRKAHPITDVSSAAWSWIVGHLPPPQDVEMHILCPVFGMKERSVHFDYGGAHWHCFRLKRFEPLFLRLRFYWSVRAFVKKLKPDVVHGWGGESGCGLLATYCSRFAIISVQGQLRMLHENAKRWHVHIPDGRGVGAVFRRWTEALSYRRAHRLLVEGETSRNGLRQYYGLDAEIAPHPLRKEFLSHEIRAEPGAEILFLFVGQMTARKGTMDALRAFAALNSKTARLVMVGGGERRAEAQEYVREHGLQRRIRLVERCGVGELLELMDGASAFLAPSYGDTGPTALKEALSQGLYPICYENTGPRALVEEYGFGKLCPTGDVMSLTAAMEDVCRLTPPRNIVVAERVRCDLSHQRIWHELRRVYGRSRFEIPLQRGGAVEQRIGHFASMLPNGSPVVISFHTGVRQNIRVVWRARMAGLKVVREINEWPLSVIWGESVIKRWLEIHLLPKLFDGAICISDVLVDFWEAHGRRGCPILKVPMTVDVDAIDATHVADTGGAQYICYAGANSEAKDGVDTLKRAYVLARKRFPNIELKLLHDLPHDEAIAIMKGAACLALARPDSLQARAGFPTKLGEYLACGRPVVVTKVGEIPSFLEDGRSAYLAESGNAESIAAKIVEVLENPAKAEEIGRAGREITLRHFNWLVHEKVLEEWLKQFI